jgi:hypothetical protein
VGKGRGRGAHPSASAAAQRQARLVAELLQPGEAVACAAGYEPSTPSPRFAPHHGPLRTPSPRTLARTHCSTPGRDLGRLMGARARGITSRCSL